ncbi:MAG: helix-turn-helix transcriptional regulator [Clostridiales bacterium]|nr:helix-turn-helix transcriptional regulator [Clostridiales bacterium]
MRTANNINEVRTWDDYKAYVKGSDPILKQDIEEVEQMASIVSAVIERRNQLGISQRELASMCGLPQSSVARIETCKTTPNLSTLLKMLQPLGLTLRVSPVAE